MNILYRVILKVGYYESWFEFTNSLDAMDFATAAMKHMVSNEDTKRKTYITVHVVNKDLEDEENKEDEQV